MKGDIPSTKIYENEETLAFLDISPVNKGHTLVVPKQHYADFLDAPEEVLEKVVAVLKTIAAAFSRLYPGFNIGLNNGSAAGQIVMHTHFHLIPRLEHDGLRHWPGGTYKEGEAQRVAELIKTHLST